MLYAVCAGDAVFVTFPFELFAEYGLRVKTCTRTAQMRLIRLSNVSPGYLPTEVAARGGSYSSKPASAKRGPDSEDVPAASCSDDR